MCSFCQLNCSSRVKWELTEIILNISLNSSYAFKQFVISQTIPQSQLQNRNKITLLNALTSLSGFHFPISKAARVRSANDTRWGVKLSKCRMCDQKGKLSSNTLASEFFIINLRAICLRIDAKNRRFPEIDFLTIRREEELLELKDTQHVKR